ncbi:RNA recognition motif [Gracilaria domingensis]|nr:RNA recognition motif [Gracilaria domingensis]
MAEEEEDVPQCPLCLEELDSTDRAVEACQCGYQICLWCLHHIREQLNSLCPACRTPYQEQNFKYAQVNPEEAAKEAKERATAKKERERREKMKEIEKERARAAAASLQKAKSNLKHARILQKNLVYVIGLSLTLAREEAIRRADMFGKFGRMLRILVNRSHPFNADAPGGPSISAYVQYARDSDASAAVRGMNNAVLDGREIRCAIATTKYCDAFVRNAATSLDPTAAHYCGNQNCMYYHSLCTEDTLTREEVLARQLGPPPPGHLFLPAVPNGRPANGTQSIHPRLAAHSVASGLVPANRATTRSSVLSSSSVLPPSSAPSSAHPPSSSLPSLPVPSLNAGLTSSQNPNSSTGNLTTESSSPRRSANPDTHQLSYPNGTPPPSPRDTRRPTARLQRSPASREPVPTNKYPRSSPTSTSSKPPPVASIPLPSSAGWASSQALSTSRSSPRHGQSTTFDDATSSRPKLRLQPRRSREPSPPPGFENATNNSAAVPSKPPGFDVPVSSVSSDAKTNVGTARDRKVEKEVGKTVSSSAMSHPPGFGPAAASQPIDAKQTTVNDVAAAWAQEAASDEVFSAKDKRQRNDFVGQFGREATPMPKDNPDSRSDLAQVLAKIGGDLGVASEVKRMQSVQSKVMQARLGRYAPNPIGSSRNTKFTPVGAPARLGSLFGNQATTMGYSAPTTPFPSATAIANPIAPPSTPAYRTAFANTCSNTFAQKSLASRASQVPMASPRRHTSRFMFAQREGAADIPQSMAPRAASFQPKSASFQMSTPPAKFTASSPPPEIFGRTQTESDVRQERSFMNDLLHAAKPPKAVVQGASRQNRSRFDFADHGAQPQNANYPPRSIRRNSSAPPTNVPRTARGHVNQNDSIASLAQLSTQEKLASIFNSAQMSGEALPPMPTFDAHIDPLGNPNIAVIPSKPVALDDSHRSFRSTTQATQVVAKEKSRVPDILHPRQSSMPPPGFREATPGISPESTKVEKSSTTSGVAKNVASGGESSTSKKESHYVEESVSSGTDSHEDDRRRTRTQRKREKKGGQPRESTERNSNAEAKQKNGRSISSTPTVHPVQVTQPVKVTQPHHTANSAKGVQSQPSQSVQPAQPVKVTKPVQQVPRTRGDAEIESLRTLPAKSAATSKLQKPELVPEAAQDISVAKDPQKDPQVQASKEDSAVVLISSKLSEDPGKYMSVSELEREVEAARAREAQLQDKLLELQRRIRSYDNVRT